LGRGIFSKNLASDEAMAMWDHDLKLVHAENLGNRWVVLGTIVPEVQLSSD